jgi:maltooligosyltrehalose trehalohydrolase
MSRNQTAHASAATIPAWRRYPIGVELAPAAGGAASVRAHARVWAPGKRTVEFVACGADDSRAYTPLTDEGNGYFSGLVDGVSAGARYRFRLDGGESYPDPASRFQPEGPHGPSEIVDPTAFVWTDDAWRGASIEGQVVYELHVGTFTPGGTYRDVIARLPEIVDLGATVIELMPVADFAGRFGWGYDGVDLFAPCRLYGGPDDLRALVDAAHQHELAIILDVVYNHLGPDGNYLTCFSRDYLSSVATEWGDAINFDGNDSGPVREFFTSNARYWIDEYHFDGLRLDATQQIWDKSEPHILTEIGAVVREAANGRATLLIAENETQHARLVRDTSAGGYGLDALWNDDFHHSAHVAATGHAEAYYTGYRGSAQELISCARYGYLYQGEWYEWQHHRRGTPAFDLPPTAFVNYLQNHDQVANSSAGARMHRTSSPGRVRALTMLLLLLPQTPMLFQGQEFAASAPFLFFADHTAELAAAVRKGRRDFLKQFASIATPEGAARLDDPADPETFVRCKLDWTERTRNTQALDFHRHLLALRRTDPVLSRQQRGAVDGAVLAEHAFVLRWFGTAGDDRLLIVNLRDRLHALPAAEPLLGLAPSQQWATLFSSEDTKYGGWGTPSLDGKSAMWIPAESAVLLMPVPVTDDA